MRDEQRVCGKWRVRTVHRRGAADEDEVKMKMKLTAEYAPLPPGNGEHLSRPAGSVIVESVSMPTPKRSYATNSSLCSPNVT